MKTSWTDNRLIDRKLNGHVSPQETLLHEAKMIIQPSYREAFLWQKKTYPLVKLYGQNKLRKEMDEVFDTLFNQPQHQTFRLNILKLFAKNG